MNSPPETIESLARPETNAPGGLTAWLQLIRLPNAFTVPGDVVAGWFLAGGTAVASGGPLFLLISASVSIYWSGLILNDCFDLEIDRGERPDRPLPSGRVPPAVAWSVGLSLLALGVILAALAGGVASAVVGGVLALLVLLYDGPARSVPVLGFLTMGLCRGTNLVLGASILDPGGTLVILAAGITVAYIATVTRAAAVETEGPPRGTARWAPFVVPLLGLPALLAIVPGSPTIAAIAATLLTLFIVFRIVKSFQSDLLAAAVPPKIGALIRALIPLQATFVLAAPATSQVPALLVLALLPLSVVAGRRFYGS
jgi:4-hydroxybenzoate polyprenyltransferase